jgi:4-amino-4-deoxy-L-arabinose transferase-like glycosyltransferase
VREGLAWLLALVLASVALGAISYRTRDPDSRLYAEIAAQMAERPLGSWIAPTFPPGWYESGLFREHPVGIHLLPALLGRLGYPPLQAAYAANALYQVLTLVLISRLAATLVSEVESRALTWLLQLLPIAFTYRIRANHEQALLLCLLLALYGAERARRQPAWSLGLMGGLAGLLLVKGVFVLFGLLACVLWLGVRGSAEGGTRVRGAWAGLALAVVAVGAAAWLYELAYRASTGESFWAVNLGRQLGVASVPRSGIFVVEKLRNLVWYAARVLWFPFPWSVVLALGLLLARRSGGWLPERGGARHGLVFVLLLTVLWVGAFSLSDRRADRYIFPVYFAVGAAGAVMGLRSSARLFVLADRLQGWHPWPAVVTRTLCFGLHLLGGLSARLRVLADRLQGWHPWPAVVTWTLCFGLHFLGGLFGLPRVKIWPPNG